MARAEKRAKTTSNSKIALGVNLAAEEVWALKFEGLIYQPKPGTQPQYVPG
jgi:hypothetical protein